jgi:putative MATE family efflux protein
MKETMIRDMTKGPLFKQLVAYSVPIIVGNILQSLYNVVDMLIVGNYVGAGGLAAAGIGGLMQMIVMMTGMALSFGGQILLSQQVGAGEKENIKKTIGTLLSITFLSAVVLGILGLVLTDWMMKILNTPPEVWDDTRRYYRTCCFGVIFVYGYNGLGSILRGLGQSKLPTVFVAIASVLNIILDYVFVARTSMGVAGAALATVIAQGVSFIFSLIYLILHRDSFGFDFRPASFRIGKRTLAAILKISAPMMGFTLVMSLSTMFINSNINVYGVAASAVDSIGNKLFMVCNCVVMGVYSGGAAIIGQCFGAQLPERIKKAFLMTLWLSLLCWAVVAVILVAFPRQIFGFFTDDADVLAMATKFMLIEALMFLGMALAGGPFALFEGLGRTDLEMWAGILENIVVKVLVSLAMAKIMGVYGYWLGMAIAGFTTPLCGFLWYWSGRWKKQKRSVIDVSE